MPRTPSIADNIVATLQARNLRQANTWELADALFNNCMQRNLPGNGGRITALVKAAQNDARLYREGDNIGLL